MCRFVYIASDRSLPLIEWQEDAPAFHVRELGELGEEETSVRRYFSKSYVYYVGSHEGCGCGFSYGQMSIADEVERAEDAAARESVRRLREYLTSVVETDPVELYMSWSDDLKLEPTSRATIIPDDIGGEAFEFEERQLLTVVKTPPTGH